MKKILCLIDSLGSGGAQRQLVGLAIFLKEQGYDVIVSYYHDRDFYVETLVENGIPYVYLRNAGSTILRPWHIARFIHQTKPDVVIAYLETPSICSCIAKFFNRSFKLIVSERNTTQHTGKNEKIRFFLFRMADLVVPNSYSQETYLNVNFPKLSNKIVTIPNFVDLEHFVPPVERQCRVIPEIMVAASIWASKNTLGFIDAVAQLKHKQYKFHVNWYGKSVTQLDYYNKCQDKIVKLGVADCITLKEKTLHIKECYQDADYFCLPSFYEGTPNVICEAMACGLPIVCSNVCDNSRYIEEGVNGFLFDPHDTESIVIALEKMLLLDESDYNKYCVNSRERAERMLSKQVFVQSYINLLEQ